MVKNLVLGGVVGILLFLLATPITIGAQSPVLTPDVTSKLEYLGTPSKKVVFARNVWDLFTFNNKIYIGSGDTGDNAGPIPIMAYDPATSSFADEYTVNEEQINTFTLVEGILTIPGNDSREGWDLGNYYQLLNGTWTKFRRLPGGVHVFDVASSNGVWLAALGTDLSTFPAAISTDKGATWKSIALPQGAVIKRDTSTCTASTIVSPPRVLAFFTIGNDLYANTLPISEFKCLNGTVTSQKRGTIVKWNGQGFELDSIDVYQGLTAAFIMRPVVFGNQTVYIAATNASGTVSRAVPVSLMTADANRTIKKLSLPNCDLPYDTLVRGNQVFVLCNSKVGTTWRVSVKASSDASNWSETFFFTTDTFARSFEELNGDWYFGLGSDYQAVSPSTGKIFRVKTSTPNPQACSGDINSDNQVNLVDYSLFVQAFFKPVATQPRADLNADGQINLSDYSLLVNRFLKPC